VDHEKAACTNFLGKKTFETGSNIYGPFLGWFFAVLATPTIMIAMIFACVAHSRNKKDSYENLSSPRANTYGHQSFESLSLNWCTTVPLFSPPLTSKQIKQVIINMQHKRKRGKEEDVGEEESVVAGIGPIKQDRLCSLVDMPIEDYENLRKNCGKPHQVN